MLDSTLDGEYLAFAAPYGSRHQYLLYLTAASKSPDSRIVIKINFGQS